MHIIDLETCELVEFDNQIVGGAQTYADALTFAGKGIAYAEANALALGDSTSTISKASTNTFKTDTLNFSFASASAEAKAKDENGYSSYSDKSLSIWVSNS
ncbi:MAG: hypothetical protein ACFB2X_06405 [Rivularia sp. (in: cyanobacteria)]